ncbi:MAG: hypothetical protein ABJM86_11135 [Hyphomicrobiales bacterium]
MSNLKETFDRISEENSDLQLSLEPTNETIIFSVNGCEFLKASASGGSTIDGKPASIFSAHGDFFGMTISNKNYETFDEARNDFCNLLGNFPSGGSVQSLKNLGVI